MSKHTPGPWVLVGNSIKSRKADCIVVRLPADTDCVGDESDQQIERWDADSNLIAAAPELLNALEGLFEEYEDRRAQFGSGIFGSAIWKKYEDVVAIEEARRLLDELKGVRE
jgi:hypothetical protein